MLTEALDETDDTSPAPFSWHLHCVNNEWRWVKLQKTAGERRNVAKGDGGEGGEGGGVAEYSKM